MFPVLTSLHCPPVCLKIDIKILLIAFKSLCSCAPGYTTDLFAYRPVHTLRSWSRGLLSVPGVRQKEGFTAVEWSGDFVKAQTTGIFSRHNQITRHLVSMAAAITHIKSDWWKKKKVAPLSPLLHRYESVHLIFYFKSKETTALRWRTVWAWSVHLIYCFQGINVDIGRTNIIRSVKRIL